MELRKNKFALFPFLLFILLAIYSYQDVLLSAQAGIVGQNRSGVHIWLLIILSFLFLYVAVHKNKGYSLKLLVTPLYLWLAYILFNCLINSIPISEIAIYPMFVIWWILTLSAWATFTTRNYNCFNETKCILILLLIVWTFLNIKARLGQIEKGHVLGTSMFIYNVVLLTPFIFFIKSSKIKYSFLAVSIFFTLLSFKRGAIITLPCMILAFYWIKSRIEGLNIKFIGTVVLVLLFSVCVLFYIDSNTGGLLLNRFNSEDLYDGSGRNNLRETIISALNKRDFDSIIFGSGPGTTLELLGTGAHNEWLEAMYCYGLVGVVLYIWMFFSVFVFSRRLYKRKSPYAAISAMYVVYLGLCSMFSGFLFMHTAFYYWTGLGVISGLEINRRNNGTQTN